MIPRYQRILFWSLITGIFLMAAFLLRGCEQAHRRLTALNNTTPIAAPTAASTEDVTLYLAKDADGSISPVQQQLALPQDPSVRARVLIERLISQCSLPDSTHPLQSGVAVDDVFLLNLPVADASKADAPDASTAPDQLAVINLRESFVDNHPSGIEVETLTIQSIIGTLHAALPEITQIRFLVNGQPHDTLAGHADLLRTYAAVDTTTKPVVPVAPDDTPDSSQP
jgi:hypothetical protein